MKILLSALVVLLFTTSNVFAACKGQNCDAKKNGVAQTQKDERFSKHMRLHKGIDEPADSLTHCVDVGDISKSKRFSERSKNRVKAFKQKRKSNRAIRVVVDESSNACEIGTI